MVLMSAVEQVAIERKSHRYHQKTDRFHKRSTQSLQFWKLFHLAEARREGNCWAGIALLGIRHSARPDGESESRPMKRLPVNYKRNILKKLLAELRIFCFVISAPVFGSQSDDQLETGQGIGAWQSVMHAASSRISGPFFESRSVVRRQCCIMGAIIKCAQPLNRKSQRCGDDSRPTEGIGVAPHVTHDPQTGRD
jgi:hypothetical protein